MIEPGTILQNRYLIQKRIGEGGMGTVYLASDQRFNSPVAIKETLFNDQDLQRAFEREAQLLNSLRHPALPHVSDHFIEGSGQFLVMEYIPGEDLSEMLKRRSHFAVADVLRWADQLLDALDYLHTQNPPVIHRDIKPQNLKITPRGEIILLDFGLAKGRPGDTSKLTLTNSIFGYSRSYSSLEQIQGTGTDPRSDLYSLAATIYHLLAGKSPVDALTRATKVLNGEPDPLLSISEVNSEVPHSVAAVLDQALALNANVRPASAVVMRQALQTALSKNFADSASINEKTALDAKADHAASSIQIQANKSNADKNKRRAAFSNDFAPIDPEETKIAAINRKNQAEFDVHGSSDVDANHSKLTQNASLASDTSFAKKAAAPNIFQDSVDSNFEDFPIENRRSWLKSASVVVILAVLGGASFAAWYATSANNSAQNANHLSTAINSSADKKADLVNSVNKSAAVPAPSVAPPQRATQTSLPGQKTPDAIAEVKNTNNPPVSNEDNKKPESAQNVIVVKSAPPTRSAPIRKSKNTIDEDAGNAPGDDSSIEVHDLRNLPAEERSKIIDDVNDRKAESERRNERFETRQRRAKDKRRKQNLPILLGAPPQDDENEQ